MIDSQALDEASSRLAQKSQWSAANRTNESDLRADLFLVLAPFATDVLGILPQDVRQEGTGKAGRYDSMFGRCIIEYKRPNLLDSESERESAARQAIQYLEDLSLGAEVVMVTDGKTWGLLRDEAALPELGEQAWFDLGVIAPTPTERFTWRELLSAASASHVLSLLATVRAAPVSNVSLLSRLGPQREEVATLIAALANALHTRTIDSRTDILFRQWLQLAGISYGISSVATPWPRKPALILGDQLAPILEAFSFAEAVFVLHSYIALAAKLIAAEVLALTYVAHEVRPTQWLSLKDRDLIRQFVRLEDGAITAVLRAPELLSGDLFGWYAGHLSQDASLVMNLRRVLRAFAELAWARLANTRGVAGDLLRDFYSGTVPSPMRKALGEFFTPRWVAERMLLRVTDLAEDGAADLAGSETRVPRLLDPACGSGTFLVAALRRALVLTAAKRGGQESADTVSEAIHSVIGCDINPVAVLMSRVNLLLALGDRVNMLPSVDFPVYQTDSILLPDVVQGQQTIDAPGDFRRLPLQIGDIDIPAALASAEGLGLLRANLEAGVSATRPVSVFQARLRGELDRLGTITSEQVDEAVKGASKIYAALLTLEREGKNRIWARVIEQSFAPTLLKPVDIVIGNPPWINWKHVPNSWQQRSQPVWTRWGLWQRKRKGGGVPLADMSVLLLARSIATYCKPGGIVAFLLPQSILLADPGNRAIRRCTLGPGAGLDPDRLATREFMPLAVDDFSALHPFSPDAANQPVALYVKTDREPIFPIIETDWRRASVRARIDANDAWPRAATQLISSNIEIAPIDAGDRSSPWARVAVGSDVRLRSPRSRAEYVWGQGFHTRGADGLFVVSLVTAMPTGRGRLVRVRVVRVPNANAWYKAGFEAEVEADYLWPLLRGQDVDRFQVRASGLYMIVPHDPNKLTSVLTVEELAARAPHLFDFLEPWIKQLAARSPYQELQPTPGRPWGIQGPWMHLDRTAHLVLCRYMHPDKRPPAAIALPHVDSALGMMTASYPNNKSNFVHVSTEDEAWYLAGCVNSSGIQNAIARFVSSITIGPAALQRLPIPKFRPGDPDHRAVVDQSRLVGSHPTDGTLLDELDRLVRVLAS